MAEQPRNKTASPDDSINVNVSVTGNGNGNGNENSNSNANAIANNGIVGRVRAASLSLMNANPQLGMWQAAGTAIAHAPNLTELRDAESGGENIAFNAQGHSSRFAVQERDGELSLVRHPTRRGSFTPTHGSLAEGRQAGSRDRKLDETARETPVKQGEPTEASRVLMGVEEGEEDGQQEKKRSDGSDGRPEFRRRQSLHEKHMAQERAAWGPTIAHGLKAFWKFFLTPSGFLITIYCLNIVAWGAMLFFLLLKAAPAMNHPSADDVNSPRKKWLEISSQILNGLFCVTGFGLAPWRFRDLYLFIRATNFKDRAAMRKLAQQNKGWFRPPAWAVEEDEKALETFTGKVAPPTPMWKLGFTIWMMVLNTFVQAVLCFFMWHYNRIDRPSWATGTFIGLGCGVAMLAGIMSWWEGRRVKKIEGPQVKVVQDV